MKRKVLVWRRRPRRRMCQRRDAMQSPNLSLSNREISLCEITKSLSVKSQNLSL